MERNPFEHFLKSPPHLFGFSVKPQDGVGVQEVSHKALVFLNPSKKQAAG
jgi:hypothetical protein